MQRCGYRAYQTEGTVSAKAIRWERAWYFWGKKEGSVAWAWKESENGWNGSHRGKENWLTCSLQARVMSLYFILSEVTMAVKKKKKKSHWVFWEWIVKQREKVGRLGRRLFWSWKWEVIVIGTRLVRVRMERSKSILEYISEMRLSGLGRGGGDIRWCHGTLRWGACRYERRSFGSRAVWGNQCVERASKCKWEIIRFWRRERIDVV